MQKKLDTYYILVVYSYMKLTKKTKKLWFLKACYEGKPIIHKHHTIPKHHGGHDSDTIEVTVWEHAQLHKDIYLNGYSNRE